MEAGKHAVCEALESACDAPKVAQDWVVNTIPAYRFHLMAREMSASPGARVRRIN
jgi:hypothetical protein